MSDPAYITVRKHTFLSSAALGFSVIVVTLLVSCTAVLLYTVHLASEKSERVITLAQDAIKGLPELTQALPPAVADMLDDQRRPDYCKELTITAQATPQPDDHGRVRTTVEIVNNGAEVVSLMSLRILLVDEENVPLCESQEWAATPFAADDGWRGPILPGSRRHFVTYRGRWERPNRTGDLRAEVEVTELRVWNNPKNASPTAPTTAAAPRPPGPAQPGELTPVLAAASD
ncbi:MAG: hypothetical protein MUC88_11035 [Planctomycetes bacterium]|jgi:hypothetical protein|nr:hypothetical protein [Planctomycetota bacterium]